ncbi:MAG TPA: aromatic ring-hydroxylating dioxygenase subunit alpha [Candidatus Limnocylindrales bacterium]|jgi:Rieske 2Fe-2S family protein|nr:aromatic ring-hydroxylating dioxygenase subunit alpha [Candidatus Limnocylindrales bacterium]
MTHGPSPITPDELASIRREYRAASLLPKRAYHDSAIFDWERANIVRRDWVMVAREEDVADPGSYLLVDVDGDPLIVVRGRDGQLRGFHNVCRHRGTAVAEEPCGKVVRFQCPYHAWIYDLDGALVRAKHTDDLDDFAFADYGLAAVRLDTWQGFIFLNLDPGATSLRDQLGDLVEQWTRFDFTTLRRAKRIEYEVAANWKFIAENYSECYHCPGVHPQLNKLTPYDLGGDFDPDGAWQGGWMELADGAETMALDGGHGSRDGRPPMRGITPRDERCVYYYLVWPTTFLSIHPDYLLVHRLVPSGPDRTTVVCDWLFEAETIAAPGFDPSDEIAFWDLTNTQDWHVCELQQRGTRSSSFVAGRYSNVEASVHAFDQMVADRYVGDAVWSKRVVRERYDLPPPKPDANGGATAATTETNAGVSRTGARSRAATNR